MNWWVSVAASHAAAALVERHWLGYTSPAAAGTGGLLAVTQQLPALSRRCVVAVFPAPDVALSGCPPERPEFAPDRSLSRRCFAQYRPPHLTTLMEKAVLGRH